MNCWKGVCKYKNENKNICTVDGKKCDMSRRSTKYGVSEYHCHQENNEDLCMFDPDDLLADEPLPFWSCQNICKHYDFCNEQ
jgi:hypothetical protein